MLVKGGPGHKYLQYWLNINHIESSFIQKYYTYSEQQKKMKLQLKKMTHIFKGKKFADFHI